MSLRLADPQLLLALALVPLVLWWHLRRGGGSAVRFSSVAGLERLGGGGRLLLRHVPLALRLLALALWALALARPQAGRTTQQVRSEGIDIMLLLDTSNSMEARDLEWSSAQRTRLEVSRDVLAHFIRNRPGDRIGLVVFGEHAFTQCPLTLDHGVLLAFLEQITIGHAGGRATALGEGLGTAVKRLKDVPAKSKVIVLLTDGRNNSGDLPPEKAAELARTYDIKVYAVGAGTRGKAPFFEQTLFGRRVRYEDVDIDDAALTRIAGLTGGRYFRATDGTALQQIYDQIDRLEKVEVVVSEHTEFDEHAAPLIIAGLALLLIEALLSATWLRKVP